MKLYVIRGSHACRAAMLMLAHKGQEYDVVTLPSGLHPVAIRLFGFPGSTVPAVRAGGERVQTNPAIARFLDRVRPEPPLLPPDDRERVRVEEAEAWGHTNLQMTARRLTFAAALHGRDGLIDRGASGRLGPLLTRSDTARYLGAHVAGKLKFNVNSATERQLLDRLPAMLDRIDGWIGAGVLNGADLNAADFVIAPNLALLCYREDLRSQVEPRPAGSLLDRVLPAV